MHLAIAPALTTRNATLKSPRCGAQFRASSYVGVDLALISFYTSDLIRYWANPRPSAVLALNLICQDLMSRWAYPIVPEVNLNGTSHARTHVTASAGGAGSHLTLLYKACTPATLNAQFTKHE